jgi:hypothetical protein
MYILPGSVCLSCCREIFGPILGIYIGTEAAQFPEKEYINGSYCILQCICGKEKVSCSDKELFVTKQGKGGKFTS